MNLEQSRISTKFLFEGQLQHIMLLLCLVPWAIYLASSALGSNILRSDPLFVDVIIGDFHLLPDSVATDAGVPEINVIPHSPFSPPYHLQTILHSNQSRSDSRTLSNLSSCFYAMP